MGTGENAAALAAATTVWSDQWWDAEAGLLWNPRGSEPGVPARTRHLVPATAWYALGLLQRAAPGDGDRAVAALEALCGLQYHEPGTPWHGTFARFAETPHPGPGAVMWEDYDPNWRQFLATAFLLVLDHEADLPRATVDGLRGAIDLAVRSEPPDRVPAWYTNIALKRAYLEVEHGLRTGDADLAARGDAYAREIVARFDEHGAFDEYNSPTYAGVDLYALAFWATRSSSDALGEWGARLETALWRELADRYHAGLRNLAGPYTRAYGVDMTAYLGKVGMWIAATVGLDAAPVPALAGPCEHSADWCFGPCVDALGVRAPADVVPALRAFPGEHTAARDLAGGRRATAWLGDDAMTAGEASDADWGGWEQFVPAVAHWRRADGGVAWLRIDHAGPVRAVAEAGALAVEGAPGAVAGIGPRFVVAGGAPASAFGRDGDWTLPGRRVRVEGAALGAPDAIVDWTRAPDAVAVPIEATDGSFSLTIRLGPG